MFFSKKGKRKATSLDSLVGQNTQISGDIHFSGGLHVDGLIRGAVVSADEEGSMLTLSDRGTIEGDVRVPYAVINGAVIGDVHVRQHVELAPNARIQGNVYYNLIEMAMGAEVNGQLIRQVEGGREPLALSHRPETAPKEAEA
jgi:cytoskeletal protein CcmA (bactofilin family)